MNFFLVGGAVRDRLLGVKVEEKDWVVTGTTPEAMVAQGFRPVGSDFPVFIHPESGEEYALARTERKSGKGYQGFVFNTSPDITLEEDLARRDLTINAMARTPEGALVDPYHGRRDIKARILRHVSPAFAEDPLRVLRIARFAARYHWLGFCIANETRMLMKTLVDSGELQNLTPERIWKEMSRALMEKDPQVFFQELENCGALLVILPELARLRGVPQPEQHHPEIDTLEHQYMALKQAAMMHLPLTARFALLVHDLGKGLTPASEWPRHIGHEKTGVKLADQVAQRMRTPTDCRDLGKLTAEYHTHSHRALELRPATLWKLLRTLDALRRPQRLEDFLAACEADARGRKGKERQEYPQADHIRGAAKAALQVDNRPLREKGLTGAALGKALEETRIRAIRNYCQQKNTQPLPLHDDEPERDT